MQVVLLERFKGSQFRVVALVLFRQSSGLFRDQPDDTRCAFVVEDGAYVSARWPGDAHLFAQTVAKHVLVGCASAHRAGPGHAMVR